MRLRSLHARLIAGAAIWSAGLLAAAIAIAIFVVVKYPRYVFLVHSGLLAVGSAVLVTAGVSVIRRGMSPFSLLRERLAAVREGRSARLEGEYPTEVAPLVNDLNTLLDERERRVSRAIAMAGDLAHGLKTPLAILTQEMDRVDASGHTELAGSIRQQVERMRRQIGSHLAQARVNASGAGGTARANVSDVLRGLVRTTERLYAARTLVVGVDVPAGQTVRVPVDDLEEMIGNLLDNACKWARTHVQISTRTDGTRVVISVDDDGAGIAPDMRARVLQRGVRADETAPGSGLGLAIVRDLAEAYGGSVSLDRSVDGGVRAQLTLPSAGVTPA